MVSDAWKRTARNPDLYGAAFGAFVNVRGRALGQGRRRRQRQTGLSASKTRPLELYIRLAVDHGAGHFIVEPGARQCGKLLLARQLLPCLYSRGPDAAGALRRCAPRQPHRRLPSARAAAAIRRARPSPQVAAETAPRPPLAPQTRGTRLGEAQVIDQTARLQAATAHPRPSRKISAGFYRHDGGNSRSTLRRAPLQLARRGRIAMEIVHRRPLQIRSGDHRGAFRPLPCASCSARAALAWSSPGWPERQALVAGCAPSMRAFAAASRRSPWSAGGLSGARPPGAGSRAGVTAILRDCAAGREKRCATTMMVPSCVMRFRRLQQLRATMPADRAPQR